MVKTDQQPVSNQTTQYPRTTRSFSDAISGLKIFEQDRVVKTYRANGGAGQWCEANKVRMVDAMFSVENELESKAAKAGNAPAKCAELVRELHKARLRIEDELGWSESPIATKEV